jgi:A/G-specific adenine glycosylase
VQTQSFVRRLTTWSRDNRRDFPWRREGDPFRVLVAEVLLQRSRGSTVARIYEELFDEWTTAADMAEASDDAIAKVIRPLGLTRRAATLRNLAAEVERLDGVPRSYDELLQLPGVGPYAASATLAVAFSVRAPVVDGVSARVYRRYFGLDSDQPASTDRDLWALVENATPRTHVKEWNWAVLDLAAEVCLPKIPRCDGCPLQSGCAWAQASA